MHKEALAEIWAALVVEVKTLLENNVEVSDPRAQDLATRWMVRLEQDTSANRRF
ncbi:Uncharacterised protein [Leclercia adecarboxylata]|uniref:Uncharacterized protein n=1 Tax=Leclercia adecarboxylata TaxID=83655 RepID=A0A4U9HZU9_9ENTR|nr:Uncharacterised protein [Leclercia adecarboxylata]